MDLYPGEVHVVAGENGSGKSTLLKTLSGLISPDTGSLLVNGHTVRFDSVRDAVSQGIVLIRQELNLVPELSVAENVFLGHRALKTRGLFDRRATAQRAAELFERLGVNLRPTAVVGMLRPDEQQLVEIARALSYEAKVVLMDEPTSSLDSVEAEHLLDIVRDLASQGIAIAFISHRTPEMLAVGDQFTVLRDGEVVACAGRNDVDEEMLLTKMVGRHVVYPEAPVYVPRTKIKPSLELVSVSDETGFLRNINFSLDHGEIVGIAGLVGSGRTELLHLIAGLRPLQTGSRILDGQELSGSAPEAVEAGITLVPEERAREGIFPNLSILENMLLPGWNSRTVKQRRVFRYRAAERQNARAWIESVDIKVEDLGLGIATLSGGNQQKVVLARSLGKAPRILLLDEPTRGVDIGARVDIYRTITELADTGTTILIASSELAELRAIAHRVLVMHAGSVTADLHGSDLNDEAVIAYATGVF